MNKILYTLTFLLLAKCSNAQTYTQQRDSLLQYLDPELVPTGVLYDRVFPWADLTADTLDIGKVSYEFAQQAWYELELASYYQSNMLTLEMAKTRVRQNATEERGISIGFIDYEFNSIDSTAIDRGSLVYGEDSLLHQVDENIYLHHHTVLPFVSTADVQGEDVKFYFDPYLMLSNTGRAVERIEINLEGRDEMMTITPGEEATLHIAGIEDSIIRASLRIYFESVLVPGEFTLEWHNGNLITMSASFDADKCTSGDQPIEIFSGTGLMFQGYDESSASQGKGEYRIFYRQTGGSWANCANDIRKPIIIIDGFDPGDRRWITQRQHNGEIIKGIWDLLGYGSGKHLGDEMRKKGYDIIILNFPTYEAGTISIPVPPYSLPIYRDGGADYIERNARVLIKLIQDVNTKLQQSGSTEKIVVVGPSMGGADRTLSAGIYGKGRHEPQYEAICEL